MKKQLRFAGITALTLVMLGSPTWAAMNCSSARVKAVAKFQACVQKWILKCVGPIETCDAAKLSACSIKLDKAWPGIADLQEPPCEGARWIDNLNGSVTDQLTGLVWEIKTDDDGIHDQDNRYTFTAPAATSFYGNGTAFTEFLTALNAGGGFASANDWRIPTLAETASMFTTAAPCESATCRNAVFGPSIPDGWWTVTRSTGEGTLVIFYDDGTSSGTFNQALSGVIAVHGGIF